MTRSEAIKDLSGNSDIFSSPNNILALEYIKALRQSNSTITPLTLQRNGAGFHSDTLSKERLPSAKAIRKSLADRSDNTLSRLTGYVPDTCLEALQKNTLLFQDDFSQILLYRLLQNTSPHKKFSHFYDISPELSNTIAANTRRFVSFETFAHLCKSRNLTLI